MDAPTHVIPRNIPKDCEAALTEGKAYVLTHFDSDGIWSGEIEDDKGEWCYILISGYMCAHLSSETGEGYWEAVYG